MNKYGQEVLQLAYSYVKNKEIAEDLTQDIFVKCFKSIHTYKGKSKLRTWVWRVAINHCKDYLKSWYNQKVIITDNETTYTGLLQESVEQTVIQNDEDHQLASAVMNLPIKYREVIYLFYFEENEGLLYSRLHRLEQEGFIKSNWVQTETKYYQISHKGRRILQKAENSSVKKRILLKELIQE